MPAPELYAGARRSNEVWPSLSLLLVAVGVAAAVLSVFSASTSSDAARAWGGLIPVAYIGLVGLRRTRALVAIAGALLTVVTVVSGVVLLRMHHLSAGVLILLGGIGAIEVLLLGLRRRAAISS